jgi:hypothetical protein
MSAPLPLGARVKIEVALGELDGKVVEVRRLNGRSLRAFRAWRAEPTDFALAWETARACVPGMTDEEMELLELDSVMRIIWLCSADLAEVEAALGKDTGPATVQPPSSTTT